MAGLGLVRRDDASHPKPCRCDECWREAEWADFDPDVLLAIQEESAEIERERRDEDQSYIEERRALRGEV